ncbi:hypothetical protein NCLIV_004260 [Neospora caninum Liverpool]|uniref:Mannosyltransferase n=1 Tax=Neospora caninum (strain Liverpool) TaxID=572307 RepID=F0V8A1_NEOCL|nr:hypothetical protein NCLIV_004260 [Neospora caninum Liverpool]CBZ49942.1 hypothetical protein NCLIV_004260 [Neospora caninum Liverpool]CEL64530.1 TPA: mannosyltransferase, putative [Neospora caninum Liverpool]|eukprot:XP_003879977.1 hypothetical protein NCLIV_004260 [Neospora caninum Liverpool]
MKGSPRERAANTGASRGVWRRSGGLQKGLMTVADRWILAGLVAYRVLNGVVLKSSFNPDEHWQSSEVAHHLVFGYGFLSWEWEPCIALRSIIHPAVFAGVYWLLGRLGWDSPSAVALSPRLVQSIIAAFTDYGTYQLAKEWYPFRRNGTKRGSVCGGTGTDSDSLPFYVLLCSVFSWFQFFCLPRTYSSCLEAALNVWSLVFFARASSQARGRAAGAPTASGEPRRRAVGSERPESPHALRRRVGSKAPRVDKGGDKEADGTGSDVQSKPAECNSKVYLLLALLLAALGVLVRPTAAMFWAVFCLSKLAQLCGTSSLKAHASDEGSEGQASALQPTCFLGVCAGVGLAAVTCSLVCDSLFYGFITFPPWNFVKFNLFADPGKFYGAKPWHYFLLEGPGVVFLSFYPFLAAGVCVWWSTVKCSLRRPLEGRGNGGGPTRRSRRGVRVTRLVRELITRDDGATALATLCALVLLSTATHKEYRFMVPFLPQLLIFTGTGVARAVLGPTAVAQQLQASPFVDGETHLEASKPYRPSKWIQVGLGVGFLVQVTAAVLCGFFHQMGSSRVVTHLQALPDTASVFFLTSCHELPYYSHVHRRIPMGFLDCSPRVDDGLPMNWQQRFWKGKKEDRIAFLDTLFPRTQTEAVAARRTDKRPSDAYSDVAENSDPRVNSWFGDAKRQQRISTNPGKCLEYRFRVPLEARELPTHLVVPNALLTDLADWLGERGFTPALPPIFDAAFAETPAGDVSWQHLLVFERRKETTT